jgi:hypothetical protein
MATLSDTTSLITEKISLAVQAQEARDYETALTYLRSARMLTIGRPSNMQKGSAIVEYSTADIDSMIADIKQAVGAAVGIQSKSMKFSCGK